MALFPIPAQVEILINGTWTDITSYVYLRDPIAITGGKTQEGDKAQPATCTMTLNNRDGRFSPSYAGGAYYPYLLRNVQLRVSIDNAQSSSGNTYSGYRFWGEVSTWPPLSDISGNDVYVQIQASGPLRRIRAHGGKGSALTRYYQTLTGSFAPIAYWPCEEDPDTSIIGAGIDGGTTMNVTTGTPKWKAISDFNGSAPIGVVNKSTWDGLTGSFGTSGDDIFDAGGTYTWVASTTSTDARVWGPAGGGENGTGQAAGGGGGEFAREATLATVIGNSYTINVGTGGQGGIGKFNIQKPGSNGGISSIVDNGGTVLVTANGGKGGGGVTPGVGGLGGTGSTNTTHFNGGNGGNHGSGLGGSGGGSSAGTAAAGNNGSTSSTNSGASGGAAPTGGGKGGDGGDSGRGSPPAESGFNGSNPGGGGGGGGQNTNNGYFRAGGNGAPGKVELIYTPQTTATVNVIRFIKLTPKHGGNPGKVLLRILTSSSVLARLDVTYAAGGKLRLQGFNGSSVQQFDSTAQAWGVDGQTVMVSVELQKSGANVAWAFKAVIPGSSTLLGSTSGTVTTASVGNVSEVLVSPNADITKTAIGHISVQYAFIPLLKVSKALHGHHTEMGIDRFIRLLNEQALDNLVEFNEGNDHFGFEAGTQSWVGTNATLASVTTTFTPVDTDTTPNLTFYLFWPPEGTHSLRLTCNGSANPNATSPTGTSGLPVLPGDTVSVNAEVYCPATKNNIFLGLLWYKSDGTAATHAEDDSADAVFAAGETKLMRVKAVAPTGAAFFAVKVGDHETPANGQTIYVDNVRIHPRMGPQTRKLYHHFLDEIEKLDQGILKEAKELHGLKFRTRIKLINQTPAVTLNYATGTISPPLAPVVDDKHVKNDIHVRRHRGSTVHISHSTGSVSILEPPAGVGRHKHALRVAAEEDAQIAALAAHLLTLGIDGNERFPTVTVNLARAAAAGNAVAPLMSAVAGVEIGDYVQMTNLPFWYPNTTAKQLVIGYTENLSAYTWDVTWNCIPEYPFEIVSTNLRRW